MQLEYQTWSLTRQANQFHSQYEFLPVIVLKIPNSITSGENEPFQRRLSRCSDLEWGYNHSVAVTVRMLPWPPFFDSAEIPISAGYLRMSSRLSLLPIPIARPEDWWIIQHLPAVYMPLTQPSRYVGVFTLPSQLLFSTLKEYSFQNQRNGGLWLVEKSINCTNHLSLQ